MPLIIAELFLGGEPVARWTDEDGPPDLADQLDTLRARGWVVQDFRER